MTALVPKKAADPTGMHHATNSERQAFEACDMAHFMEYVLGARSTALAKPLEVGRIVHDGLERWWFLWNQAVRRSSIGRLAVQKREHLLAIVRHGAIETLQRRFDELASKVPTGFTTSSQYGHMNRDSLKRTADMFVEIFKAYHARYRDQRLELLMNEEVLSCAVLTKGGNRSNRTGLAGKIDKLVADQYSQIWIMDHKTVSRSTKLVDWREHHEYSPQLAQYAVMLKRQGIEVVGVCYDLILKATPPHPSEFYVLKDGSRLSKKLPANTDFASFSAALAHHGLDPKDPYHAEMLEHFKGREDLFFRREWIRFSDFELERAEAELYTRATQIRRAHDRALNEKRQIQASRDLEEWRTNLVEIVRRRGGDYPRSSQSCYRYRRACDFLDFCTMPCTDTANTLEPWQRDYVLEEGLAMRVVPSFANTTTPQGDLTNGD